MQQAFLLSNKEFQLPPNIFFWDLGLKNVMATPKYWMPLLLVIVILRDPANALDSIHRSHPVLLQKKHILNIRFSPPHFIVCMLILGWYSSNFFLQTLQVELRQKSILVSYTHIIFNNASYGSFTWSMDNFRRDMCWLEYGNHSGQCMELIRKASIQCDFSSIGRIKNEICKLQNTLSKSLGVQILVFLYYILFILQISH